MVWRAVDPLETVEGVEVRVVGEDRVVPFAAEGQVGGVVSNVDLVVAFAAEDDVVSAARVDRVISRPTKERLRRAAAGQGVVAGSARGGH